MSQTAAIYQENRRMVMQVKQTFFVSRHRSEVWDFFGRIEDVTHCMPGAALIGPVTDDRAEFQFDVRFGPITAAFVGEAELERDDDNFRGTIRGSGRDKRGNSRARGVLEYILLEESERSGTRVDISAEFSLTGAFAQFSRSNIVHDLAARLTREFADNVEATLASAPAIGSQTAKSERWDEPGPAARDKEFRAGMVLASVLWYRVKVFMARIFGRGAR